MVLAPTFLRVRAGLLGAIIHLENNQPRFIEPPTRNSFRTRRNREQRGEESSRIAEPGPRKTLQIID